MILIQMHGHPGSGKSALARALGKALPAVVIEQDVITQALLDRGAAGDVVFSSYDAAHALAASLLTQGHSVVIDGPAFRDWVVAGARRVASEQGSRFAMVECLCSDGEMLKVRLATRPALPFQATEPLVSAELIDTAALADRLRLDTARPLEDCLATALEYLSRITTCS